MKMRSTLLRIGILVSLLSLALMMAVPAAATPINHIWYVDPGGTDDGAHGTGAGDGAFRTIQYGIDAAASSGGGTVHVAAGTYQELITLKNGVDVLGAGAVNTIIDGQALGTVVTAQSIVSGTRLDGFTITNGSAIQYGSGMVVSDHSSPTISNCIFTNNIALVGGGLTIMAYSSPMVNGCTFTNNMGLVGGGMLNYDHSSPVVTNCTFARNQLYIGGGMLNINYCSPVVTNCTFSGNTGLDEVTEGEMMQMDYSSLEVFKSISFDAQIGLITGGMLNVTFCSPTVTNCIFWDDSTEVINDDASQPTVTYCDIQGGYLGTGNINSNPLFVDPTKGDYHLSVSPCIDAGINTALYLPDTDFEGDPRIMDGDHDRKIIVDMGVDEYEYVRFQTVGGEVAPVNRLGMLVPLTGLILAFGLAVFLGVRITGRHRTG
jgi:hypothetical protein